LHNPYEELLNRYGVEIELSPKDNDLALKIQGDVTATPVIQKSWGDLPMLIYLAWQGAPNISSALQAASIIRDWWTSKVAKGEVPHGKFRYKDRDRTLEVDLKGADLDLNHLADLVFRYAKQQAK
jgi:hypothetical protein